MTSALRTSMLPIASRTLSFVRCNLNRPSSIFRLANSVSKPIVYRMPLVTLMQSLQETLKKNEVIPDVIDDFTPTTMLSITYPSKAEVCIGNTLKPAETESSPKVQITPEGIDEATYTLVLTDPDAPSRQDHKWSEYCHWILTDIKLPTSEASASASSDETASVDKKMGQELVKYMGPAPPEGTGKHRYVFLLYRNGKDGGKGLKAPGGRMKWGNPEGGERIGARHWAKKNGLELVGANFFFAQNNKQ